MGDGVLAGLRWGSARAFYGDGAFAPGDDRTLAPGWLQRLGPLVSKEWQEAPGRAATTLLAHAGWWFAHPTRAGQSLSEFDPMLQVGLTMTGPARRGAVAAADGRKSSKSP
jgi:hypothetical protein